MENSKEPKIYSAPVSYLSDNEKIYFKVILKNEKFLYDSYSLVVNDNTIDYLIESVVLEYTGVIVDITGVSILSPDPNICDVRYSKVPITPATTTYSRPAFYKYPGVYKIYFKITAPDNSVVFGFYYLRIIGISVSGSVISATTGFRIPEATIDFKIKDTSEHVKTLITDSSGEFSDEFLPDEIFTAYVTCDGYFPEEYEFDVLNLPLVLQSFVLVPDRGDVITLVLTWGEVPFDLDTYLHRFANPDMPDKPEFSIYFANKYYLENDVVVAELDIDNRRGFGPETTTIHDYTGEYEFFVKDYHSTTFPANATVKIYLPYNPRPIVVTCEDVIGSKKWNVCKIVDGEVTVVNTLTS